MLCVLQEENPGISMTDQSKKAGEIWREMGEADKKEWDKKAKEAKEAYDIEYKEWLETGGAEAIKQVGKICFYHPVPVPTFFKC